MKKYKSLFLRLIPMLLAIVLTIGMSEGFYQNMIKSETEKCWEELCMSRREASREISTRLTTNLTVLDLAADAIVLNSDFECEETILSYLSTVQAETIFDRIDVVYPNGTILVQSGRWASENWDRTYEDLLDKGSHISPRVKDHHTGQEALHFFSPVYSAEGENIAILDATIYCSTMAEIFTSDHYGNASQFFLVDQRDGNLVLDKWHETPGNIYDMMGYQQASSGADFIGAIMDGQTGRMDYLSELYGKTSYTVYAPVEGTPFTLIMVAQEDAVFASVYQMKNTLMRVGIVEVALLVFFSVWIYTIMHNSLKNENRARQAELALLHQKEAMLQSQYDAVADRKEFLEALALNLPGGYHRCTTDHHFRITFISNSFTVITGYTMEQLQTELDGSYLGIVAPEDREYFMSLAPQLEQDGYIRCAYRMRHRDGSIRWIQDYTQYVERDGETYYQCALADITEQIEDLEHARQLAEASSHAKSTFLFNISHDIRTPMNAIKGFSRIAKENADNPTLVVETLKKIEQAGDSLILLMNDVLDISRIERGKDEVNLQPMNLYAHGKNLYEMFAEDMNAAGIRFTAGGDLLNDHVYCDELKLTRIMMNMLSNAKKFTPAGGSVTFGGTRVRKDENSCTYRFFVRDTGIGMSPEFQKRAFQQFERERTSTESGITGSGLGLAIIKMLVDLLGGTVEIQSELGKGTEISATLTFQLADEALVNRTKSSQENAADMTGKRVLLVEDNAFNREIARYLLDSVHFTVEEAENGAICIEKLMAAQPGYYDLVLMDIQMPVMDGYTATIEIRNLTDPWKSRIPIIAMTANAFEEDKQKCLDAGMNGHVGKPIDMEALMQELSKVL